jgi:ABC-type Na+ efflux pump permease subunit
MTFLPIVGRELRVAARRRSTYWTRALTAVVTMLVAFFVFEDSRNLPPHAIGTALLKVISVIAFIYCLCVGVPLTADCLSEEKREGTLGLLFLTDLKGYDVVGGKLVATSLNSFYGLIAIFPVLAIPMLMGGVTNGEFWRVALVLANTFLFSLSIGMFISSITKYPRKSMAASIILLVIFAVGIPLCTNWFGFIYRSPNVLRIFQMLTPETSFGLAWDAEYARAPREYWESFVVIHGLCWLLLGVAGVIVPRSWQDNPPGAEVQRWRDTWHRWSFGDDEERVAFRRRLLDINAIYWLGGRARLKPGHVWLALAGIASVWCWGAVENHSQWLDASVYLCTSLVLNTMLKIWIASEAGRRFGEDRKIGALELVLSTPLSVNDILRGQLLALKRQFLGPLVVVLFVEGIFLLASLQSNGTTNDFEERSVILGYGMAIMVLLVADMLALGAVGMWASLTARNPNRATGIALRRILVFPWVVIIMVIVSGATVSYAAQWNYSGPKFFLGLYFVSGIVTDIAFGLGAWQRLQTEFREVAAQRYSAGPSFWSRLFGGRAAGSPP